MDSLQPKSKLPNWLIPVCVLIVIAMVIAKNSGTKEKDYTKNYNDPPLNNASQQPLTLIQQPTKQVESKTDNNPYLVSANEEKKFKTYNGKLFDLTGIYNGKSIAGYSVGVARLTIANNGTCMLYYNHAEEGQATEIGQLINVTKPELFTAKGIPFYEMKFLFRKQNGGQYDIIVQITDSDLKPAIEKIEKQETSVDTSSLEIPDDTSDMNFVKLGEDIKPESKITKTIFLTGTSWNVTVTNIIYKKDLK